MFDISCKKVDMPRVQYDTRFGVAHRTILADYLRRVIKEKGLSYREVSHRSGGRISASTVTDLLGGKNANPTVEILQGLARGIDEPEAYVFEAARGVKEPEGFTESRFWELYEIYNDLEKPLHRKMVEDHLRDLIEMLRPAPRKAKAEGPRTVEALRKVK